MSKFKITFVLLGVSLALASSLSSASPQDLEDEIQHYIKEMTKPELPEHQLYVELEWSGISDVRLYDVIERRLLENYKKTGAGELDDSAWMAKALSYSGQPKYLPTLEKIYGEVYSQNFRKYLLKSIERLPNWTKWNPDLYKGLDAVPADRLKIARVINMLNSDYPKLRTVGGRHVWWHYTDNEELLDLTKERLIATYNTSGQDAFDIDAVAWLCKGLAKSGDSKYKPLIEKIAKDARNKRVRGYAKKFLRMYYQ